MDDSGVLELAQENRREPPPLDYSMTLCNPVLEIKVWNALCRRCAKAYGLYTKSGIRSVQYVFVVGFFPWNDRRRIWEWSSVLLFPPSEFWERKENALKMKEEFLGWVALEEAGGTDSRVYSRSNVQWHFGWSEKVGGDKNTGIPEPQNSIFFEEIPRSKCYQLKCCYRSDSGEHCKWCSWFIPD